MIKADRTTDKRKQPEKENPSKPKKNEGGETFGNEPPIRDPKPAKRPDRYEVGSLR